MANKQSKTRNYKIYALYNPTRRIAFLGKSYAKTLAPIYSKHICGKNIYTKAHFGKAAPFVIPQLSVLEHVIGTYREAYRHLVAWCRVFLDAGYTMLTQEGTVYYAKSLHPATKAIYSSIRTTPLETVLQQEPCEPTKVSSKAPTSKIKSERVNASVQFNLRVFTTDMLNFVQFCESLGLSRKEGFSLLLSSCPYTAEDKTSYANEEINILKKRLASQTKTLQITQDKLEKLTLSIRNDARYQSLLCTVQAMLRDYCEILCLGADSQPFKKLKICRYHQYPNIARFNYPEDEQGTELIILKGLVYGQGRTPVIFILAERKDGQLLKYRFYPKKDYIGIMLPHSAWTFLGARWLVTWRRANDGSAELCASLPLPLSLDTLVPDDYPPSSPTAERKISLDEMIQRANFKK